MTAWYERSFGKEYLDLYAHRDLPEACANITAIDALLALPRDEPLLDLCCGGGRCLVALRRSGFTQLVGLDLSGDLLDAAAAELRAEGVREVIVHYSETAGAPEPGPGRVILVRGDMRRIPYRDFFATVLSIFTSFGYFETDDDNLAVLQEAYRALRPGGTFLLDYLNRDWVVSRLVPEDERRQSGRVIHNQRRITPDGRRVEKVVTVTEDGREPRAFSESVRLYDQADMRRMLAAAGFDDVEAYGSLGGDCCGPDSQRLVLVAEGTAHLIEYISEREIPSSAGNRLYLDYLAGQESARSLFTHGPLDFHAALAARRHGPYPRAEVSRLLLDYNAGLGAGPNVLDAARDLGLPSTFCVIGGQQVGFLGGPVFAAYKIATIIRLARDLERDLGVRVVPLYWLASEDHDLHEINHTFYRKPDGEIGRVSFHWDGLGRPAADLPRTDAVMGAYHRYQEALESGPHRPLVDAILAPDPADDYCDWHGRMWTRAFAGQGLVLVRPEVLRPVAGPFFRTVLEHDAAVSTALAGVSETLRERGYPPQITTPDAGRLYTFDARGQRVRVDVPAAHAALGEKHPERYSTDAAVRPIFADWALPVLADVLGAGEVAYQAMLRPLHDLFGVPQPVLFPRLHYTVIGAAERRAWERYDARPHDVVTGHFNLAETMARLVAREDSEQFAAARAGLSAALEPLRGSVRQVDPSLERTWAGTLKKAEFALAKLESRAHRARLSHAGLRRQELHTLRNAVLPRGRLQERTLPLPHFLNLYGMEFIERLMSAGDLYRFDHALLTLEETDARR